MRVLWLKTELLHPIDKGGKIRTYNMLKELKRKHQITYLALDDGSATADERHSAREYCHEFVPVPHSQVEKFTPRFYVDLARNLASSSPYFMTKYQSPKMRQAIVDQVSRNGFDVLVCDFLMPSINVPKDLECPTLLFQHNVEAMIWRRHYEVQTHPLKKAYFYNQWIKTRRFERDICRRFDQVATVSAHDRDTIAKDYQVGEVIDVPTGVDTDYFRPRGLERQSPYNLVFTGSMDWLPNEDAIRYFTEHIIPLIKRQVPEVTLTVVGRNPSARLLDLTKLDSSIIVTGRVEDVRPYIERAAAFIVPLRIGGGTRLKIFEAMAMEKAVISTTIGAEGLPVRHEAEVLLADSPETFANTVVRVLRNPSLGNDLGKRAANVVRQSFGWGPVADSFARICEHTRYLSQQKKAALSSVKVSKRLYEQ
ncbi:MAG TPA: glycosyltransferase [Pyrinomonadaceae bacterium]|nr:glycosyltransferase [Pyrinomonadaceae bacterium]